MGVYIDGNVVSEVSRRLIVSLLAATAATQNEKQNDSSEDENEESWHDIDVRAGDLNIVHNTLAGIAKRSSDEGKQALGRHARTIRLGRSLWQSEPLTKDDTNNIRGRHFEEGTIPPIKQIKKSGRHKEHRGVTPSSFRRSNKTICPLVYNILFFSSYYMVPRSVERTCRTNFAAIGSTAQDQGPHSFGITFRE